MLSILIPIYNVDVKKLVNALIDQCQDINEDYELICFDDKSRKSIKSKNTEELMHKFKVNYVELSENLGRAKIRNWLSMSANGDRLLFLDCDSKIIRKDFIKKYLASSGKVVHGGRIYKEKAPNLKYQLHWKYGHKYESQDIEKRNKSPYLSFMSNNFLIDAKLFNTLKFDETIKGYGYEDLVLAESIKQKGVIIEHIDNPIVHRFLDDNTAFINKTDRSLENLITLRNEEKIMDTKLIKTSNWLKAWELDGIALKLLSNKLPVWRAALCQGEGTVRILQFYKLGTFLQLQKEGLKRKKG